MFVPSIGEVLTIIAYLVNHIVNIWLICHKFND